MEHIERIKKTEPALGQVSDFQSKTARLKGITAFLQGTKEKQLKKQKDAAIFATLKTTQAERDTILRNLHDITESDCAEIYIYRLKAAELSFNRYIRLAKEARLSASSYLEETL